MPLLFIARWLGDIIEINISGVDDFNIAGVLSPVNVKIAFFTRKIKINILSVDIQWWLNERKFDYTKKRL